MQKSSSKCINNCEKKYVAKEAFALKIDMHCHVKEGSLDSKIGLNEYIEKLKECGCGGMLITDHDTYKGYRYWKKHMEGKVHQDFVVLKGIEYDTCDAGHILVIMPQGVKMRALELRGMPVSVLINFVKFHGGILGPAHPCGEKYLSITRTKAFAKSPEIMRRFDFLEGFNCCESVDSNARAMKLADKYDLLTIGGSDAHRADCVGRAYTILPESVSCETDFIRLVHKHKSFECGGIYYNKTTKERLGKVNKALVYSFWVYNKGGELLKRHGRKEKIGVENPVDPVDPVELYYTGKQKF